MKTYILFLFLFILCSASPAHAQRPALPTEHPIYLYDSVNESHFEFSGIARWRNKILLIPQHRQAKDSYHIVAIDSTSIDSVLTGKTSFASNTTKLYFNNDIDVLYSAIKTSILPRTDFGGIEAGVVVDDDIFFTIETDSLCYVIKGTIDGNAMQINFKPNDTLSLPKPDYSFGNAGFESLTYVPGQKELIAMYENNSIKGVPTAYAFTTDLKMKHPVSFNKPLLFRLTDISFVNKNTLLGLNHYYKDYSPSTACGVLQPGENTLKNEYCYYVANHLPEATKQMRANPQQTSFTRVVQLTIDNNTVNWKEKKIISYSSDNWEGILPYKHGVLLVVDGRPPGVPCKLSYFDLR